MNLEAKYPPPHHSLLHKTLSNTEDYNTTYVQKTNGQDEFFHMLLTVQPLFDSLLYNISLLDS